MAVITTVILPVFFVVALGYLVRKFGKLDERVISRVQLYILTPSLIFMAMAGTNADNGLIMKVLLHVTLLSILLYIAAQIFGGLRKAGSIERNAISMSALFTNSGFYGIPVCMLAFGEQGVVYAAIYVVCSAAIQATAGVYIASAGNRKPLEALATVFKVPLVYAIIFGRLLSQTNMLPPEPFMKMIRLLGQAAIPLGLLLLGMQLQKIISERISERKGAEGTPKPSQAAGSRMGMDSSDEIADRTGPGGNTAILNGVGAGMLKIVGGFIFGLILLRFFEFDPILRNVILVESAMPTAVNAVVYATEFDCRPRLVTVAILTSTLVSIISITLILNYLG
ncbi:MAG: AEC family transporter [Candidatus Krumholzibacteria bacterium]|nr:AEC family transporter [Candidatus Krumholzibacteria bacterium]